MGDFSYYDRFFYESLGNIFKTARIRKHLSLRELSEKLQGARSKSTLKRYEDGETRLNEDDIALLCKALSLDKKTVVNDASVQALQMQAFEKFKESDAFPEFEKATTEAILASYTEKEKQVQKQFIDEVLDAFYRLTEKQQIGILNVLGIDVTDDYLNYILNRNSETSD